MGGVDDSTAPPIFSWKEKQLKKDLVRSLVSDLQKDAVWIAAILSDLSDDGAIPSNVSAVMNTIVDGLKKLDSVLQTNE